MTACACLANGLKPSNDASFFSNVQEMEELRQRQQDLGSSESQLFFGCRRGRSSSRISREMRSLCPCLKPFKVDLDFLCVSIGFMICTAAHSKGAKCFSSGNKRAELFGLFCLGTQAARSVELA